MIYNNDKMITKYILGSPECCCITNINQNEKYIAVGSSDTKIYIYNYNIINNECNMIKTLKNGHSNHITLIKFLRSNDNNDNSLYLISSSFDRSVIYWNVTNETIIKKFEYGKDWIWRFTIFNLNKIFNNNNDILLFYVCYDDYIYICSLNELNLLYKYKIQDYCRFRCIDISPNGKYLIVGGNQPNEFKIYLMNWNLFGYNNNSSKFFKEMYTSVIFRHGIQNISFLSNSQFLIQIGRNQKKNLQFYKLKW